MAATGGCYMSEKHGSVSSHRLTQSFKCHGLPCGSVKSPHERDVVFIYWAAISSGRRGTKGSRCVPFSIVFCLLSCLRFSEGTF